MATVNHKPLQHTAVFHKFLNYQARAGNSSEMHVNVIFVKAEHLYNCVTPGKS